MLFAFMDENTDLGCTVSIDREFSISVHDTEETTYHLHLPLTLLCEGFLGMNHKGNGKRNPAYIFVKLIICFVKLSVL